MLAMLLIFKLKPVKQTKWALILAVIVFTYPVAKSDVFPGQELSAQLNLTAQRERSRWLLGLQ